MMGLLASTTSKFDPSSALELGGDVLTWILDIVKGEPILACAFVLAILVPAGFGIVSRVKYTAR